MHRKFQNHNLKSEEKMAKALAYIDAYIKENGYSPSVREIAEELGVPSSSTIAAVVEHMVNEGYISQPKKFSRNGNRIARTIQITKDGENLIKAHS